MMGIYRTFVQEKFHYKGGSMRNEQREGAKLRREKHHSTVFTQVMTNIKFIAILLSSTVVINSCSSNLIFPAGRKEASKIMVTFCHLFKKVKIFPCVLGNMV